MSAPATTRDQTEQRRQQALAAAEACIAMLTARFGAKRVVLFGSLAGQGPWHSRSDIDLAVEGLSSSDFFPAYSACSNLIPTSIDFHLVEIEHISSRMRARVLGEQPMSKNPVENLRSLLEDEFLSIRGIIRRCDDALQSIPDLENPGQLELYGMGAYLQGYYTAIETVFKRVIVYTGGTMPSGERWHKDTLDMVTEGKLALSLPLLDSVLRESLEDYLDFRHFFRNFYDEDLLWDKMRPKIERLAETTDALSARIFTFLDDRSL